MQVRTLVTTRTGSHELPQRNPGAALDALQESQRIRYVGVARVGVRMRWANDLPTLIRLRDELRRLW